MSAEKGEIRSNDDDDSDFDGDDEYSHLNNSKIGSTFERDMQENTNDKEEEKRRYDALAQAQIDLITKRSEEMKNFMVPIVVPISNTNTNQQLQPQTQAQPYLNYNRAQMTGYQAPVVRINEVIDPRYTIKQYTDRSIMLRSTSAVKPNFFDDYAAHLTDARLHGKKVTNPRDGKEPGYCFMTMKLKDVNELVLAIFAGFVKEEHQNKTNSYLNSSQQSIAVQAPPQQQLVVKRNIMSILQPLINDVLTLIIDNMRFSMTVLTTTPTRIGSNSLITDATCLLTDGRIIQIKLENFEWKIPGYLVRHDIA